MELSWLKQPQNSAYQLLNPTNKDPLQSRHSLPPRPHQQNEALWRRLAPTISLILASLCILIIRPVRSNSRDNLEFYKFVISHRVAVQVVIHILASLLTALWTYAACATANMLTRRRFTNHRVTLNILRFWTSISQGRMDFNLTWATFLACACFYMCAILPAYLWTGALTPKIVHYSISRTAVLPKVGPGAYPFLSYRPPPPALFNYECWTVDQVNGSFTSCPGLYQSSVLLQSASTATTIDSSPRNHSKNDNTGFRYTGRSYGVGSAVGLTAKDPQDTTLQNYNFTEIGYYTSAQCIYNASSAWKLSQPNTTICQDGGDACTLAAYGSFPNSKCEDTNSDDPHCVGDAYGQVQLMYWHGTVVAMGSANSDNASTYYVGIAAGSNYTQYNNTQCQLFFEPKRFAVNVSAIDLSISVEPLGDAEDPEPRGLLRSKVMDALNTISMVQTTLYVSTLGEALKTNL